MSVFISWSGEPSRSAAKALRDWLDDVLQASQPWMSDRDIDSGARWSPELTKALSLARSGSVCVTANNRDAPWLLFEAGALAKAVDARLCPYLIGLTPSDLMPPLSGFQAREANEAGTWLGLETINKCLDTPLEHRQLERLFAHNWPQLKTALGELPALPPPTKRPTGDVLDELLQTVRDVGHRLLTIEQRGFRLKPNIGEIRPHMRRGLIDRLVVQLDNLSTSGFSGSEIQMLRKALAGVELSAIAIMLDTVDMSDGDSGRSHLASHLRAFTPLPHDFIEKHFGAGHIDQPERTP